MKKQFKYYLHDDYGFYERKEYIEGQIGMKISDELAEKIGPPFYEVELQCTLDTETGEVEILKIVA